MEELRQHIQYCLRQCEKDGKELWFHQAFGAVQFYAMISEVDEFADLEHMWNNHYKGAFERVLWGQKLSL